MDKPREFWIRVGVSTIPDVYQHEPKHIISSQRTAKMFGHSCKYKGEVVHVIEKKAVIVLETELKVRMEQLKRYVPQGIIDHALDQEVETAVSKALQSFT